MKSIDIKCDEVRNLATMIDEVKSKYPAVRDEKIRNENGHKVVRFHYESADPEEIKKIVIRHSRSPNTTTNHAAPSGQKMSDEEILRLAERIPLAREAIEAAMAFMSVIEESGQSVSDKILGTVSEIERSLEGDKNANDEQLKNIFAAIGDLKKSSLSIREDLQALEGEVKNIQAWISLIKDAIKGN